MIGEESIQICVIVSILVCVCSVVAAQAFVLCCCYYFFKSCFLCFVVWCFPHPPPPVTEHAILHLEAVH